MWYNIVTKGKEYKTMTKTQLFLNIIFLVPLMVINFFVYGFAGCADLIKDIIKYSKKFLIK